MDASSWFIPKEYGAFEYEEGDKPLPLMLLDMGYDVWVGSMRGTQFSRGHTSLASSDNTSGYWDFTFAEKGMLDVPATIKKIKEVSGQSNLSKSELLKMREDFEASQKANTDLTKKMAKFEEAAGETAALKERTVALKQHLKEATSELDIVATKYKEE